MRAHTHKHPPKDLRKITEGPENPRPRPIIEPGRALGRGREAPKTANRGQIGPSSTLLTTHPRAMAEPMQISTPEGKGKERSDLQVRRIRSRQCLLKAREIMMVPNSRRQNYLVHHQCQLPHAQCARSCNRDLRTSKIRRQIPRRYKRPLRQCLRPMRGSQDWSSKCQAFSPRLTIT